MKDVFGFANHSSRNGRLIVDTLLQHVRSWR